MPGRKKSSFRCSADTQKLIVKYRKQGKTMEEISSLTGVSVGTVRNVLKNAAPELCGRIGVFMGMTPKQRASRDKKIIELRRKGLTHREISSRLGIACGLPHKVINAKAPELVTSRRLRGEKKRNRDREMVKLYRRGVTVEELARTFGFSNPLSVRHILRDTAPELFERKEKDDRGKA